MKRNNITYKKGFTLIELLVVVLIIGILSAVALPQYRRSIEASRATEAKILLRSLSDAAKRVRLDTGCYPENFSALDIQVPGTKVNNSTYYTRDYKYQFEYGNCNGILITASRAKQGTLVNPDINFAAFSASEQQNDERLCYGAGASKAICAEYSYDTDTVGLDLACEDEGVCMLGYAIGEGPIEGEAEPGEIVVEPEPEPEPEPEEIEEPEPEPEEIEEATEELEEP